MFSNRVKRNLPISCGLQKSTKSMSKDEVACLIEIIEGSPIITSKETNATTNRLKEEAWVALTAAYNAKCGSFPKQKEQLKLKWDNLKKMTRKRAQKVRMNSLKTGGGKPDFIPPDELLEKVTSLLGSTCTGFDVPFGGDGLGVGMVLELEVGGLELQNQSDHCEPETEGNVVLCPSPKRGNIN